jgi:hypothetical protein
VPSKNWIAPVGVKEPLKVAVKVSGIPCGAEVVIAGDTVRASEVMDFRVTVAGEERAAVKLVSPLYCAVIESAPAGRAVVLRVAIPDTRLTGEPTLALPERNWTVPVGDPAVELTFACNMTDVPALPELGVAVSAIAGVSCATVSVVVTGEGAAYPLLPV